MKTLLSSCCLCIAICVLCFFQGLDADSSYIKKPSFLSKWYKIVAQVKTRAFLTIPHNLNEYPVKVDVQIRIIHQNKSYFFTGMGSSQRDDDVDSPYGGVVYLYNTSHILLMLPLKNNHFAKGGIAFTGSSPGYIGPKNVTLQGPYMTGSARVRAWILNDFPTPVFNKTFNMGDRDVYKEIEHRVGFYPEIVAVRSKLDNGMISEAQGTGINSEASMDIFGLIYGYDDIRIRIWCPKQGMFGTIDGWGVSSKSTSGVVNILMWTIDSSRVIFGRNSTINKDASISQLSMKYPNSHGVSEILVSVKVKVPSGNNKGMIFDAVGSCIAINNGIHSGLVYTYTNKEILLWKPVSSKGHMLYIGGTFGIKNSQACDSVDVIITVFSLSGPKGMSGTQMKPNNKHSIL